MVTVQVGEDLHYVKMHQAYNILQYRLFTSAVKRNISRSSSSGSIAADRQHDNQCCKHAFQMKPN